MSAKKIGVYICQCGGNIGDYVDVNEVVAAVEKEQGVGVAKTAMFTCSDATQSEIIADAQEQGLDGLVIASCSPKLHTFTFRDVARRAGMNPFQYTQVNVREQCSWTHTDDHEGATEKAVRLVRAGINRTRLTDPLEPIVVETTPKSLVVGGGITGLRAALGLAEIGLSVFLVEKEPKLGGWVAGFGDMYPHGRNGAELIAKLEQKVRSHPAITVFTQAELVAKSGSFGNYEVTVAIHGEQLETISMVVGSIVIATGFDTYQPAEGELGYGLDGVITIADFKKLLDSTDGPLEYNGRPVKTVAYIYCVGSRQGDDVEGGNTYCSRYCCTAAVHAATMVADLPARVHQYHFYRDMRTYGKFELLYAEAMEKGSAFVKFPDDEPPAVEKDAKTGGITLTARDLLSEGEEVALTADLVVLVTGMVPRENEGLTKTLKLPVGQSGFYNEIHPKLRPVETVVDGAFICGACQAPRTSSESVASGLAAVTQSAAILKRGFAELDPLVATVDADACTWCGACETTCPYDAIAREARDGKEIAVISRTSCKGCGGCVPVCPSDAIDLQGYTDAQIKSMIDGMLEVVCV
ncbi:MAG TPA: CoB--CoM heterodisulfide reductase iron-sulfur subunit A family protein [Thermoleophilia bacterium]|nr:CoB--CoM heterodisulfide reductase iron-sulfur subunit A family protein [Thermoleophilia bacterium]